MTRREFARRLIMLGPRLSSTGEVPAEPTIYRYLAGKRELKVELVPYIARVLGVGEGELFSFDIEDTFGAESSASHEARDILRLLPYAPATVVRDIKERLEKYKALYDDVKG
jgi:transcriptional regulator with XRE-family HTH domain